MVWGKANSRGKPRRFGSQGGLKAKSYYNPKKDGRCGIIWNQAKNEQFTIKKDCETTGGECSRVRNHSTDQIHIELKFTSTYSFMILSSLSKLFFN